MDHAAHIQLENAEISSEALDGATVCGPDDEAIGTISHVYGVGSTSHIIVDVGGFLGIGTTAIIIPTADLQFMRDEDGDVYALTSRTKEQLESMPRYHESGLRGARETYTSRKCD